MKEITFLLQNGSGVPLYLQLYQYLKQEIHGGRLHSGEKLPSKRRVSADLHISVNTVERAYEQLEAEGYITARSRSGFYVCATEELAAMPVLRSGNAPERPTQAPSRCRYRFDTTNVDTHFFPYATWSRLSKNLMAQHREYLELGENKGDWTLRSSLCDLLRQTRGVNCTPEQVIVGAGSEYLLGILVALLGRERHYAMENPCYPKTYHILRQAGARVSLIPLDESGISVGELEQSGAEVVHITPSHQFPMGIIMPVHRRSYLLRWAERGGRYIIEDDYDSEFRYAGRPIPALQGMDRTDRVIYLTTFAKSISPSFRLSVLVLPKPLARQYDTQFRFYSSTVSRYEQHTLEQFITGGHFDRHLNKLRHIYKERRECLMQTLRSIPGGEIIGANAGLHMVFRLSGYTEEELVARAAAAGVEVTGLSSCYPADEERCLAGAVLLGYAAMEEAEIRQAGKLLRQAWCQG